MGDPGDGAVIAAEMITSDDLSRRMAAARNSMSAAAGEVITSGPPTLSSRADRLHGLWATVSPSPLERGPGLRGRGSYELKRVVRRLTSWYVEPRWAGQHEVDAEAARFASDSAARIADLERRLEHLEVWNDRLQRELHLLRRHEVDGR